ncbi:MAG: hypothetical protein C0625_10530 [Arcobacter sp.]|nr:MAG: hypothetical protein C0625_10530 [Arcobacter sp.]
MSVNEDLKIRRYRKKPIGTKTKWSIINNMRTVNMLDGLLRKESVSQLTNNYGFSKITNPIAEVRNEIEFSNILNYRIDGLRCEEYRLVDSDIARKEVELLKQKILNNIVKKKHK